MDKPVTLRKRHVRLMRAYDRQKMAVMTDATTSMLPMNKTACEMQKVRMAARIGSSPRLEPTAKGLKKGKRSSRAMAWRMRLPPKRAPMPELYEVTRMPATIR
jgi:hypothetical protein